MRILFYLAIIVVLLLVAALVDQIYYRVWRLFIDKPLAQQIRFWTFVCVSIMFVTTIVVGHHYTRIHLEVKEATIESPRLPQELDGFRIAQFSDFHLLSFSNDEGHRMARDIVEQAKAAKADILCFTGDLVTLRAAEAYPFREALREIAQAGIPVYSILGNHDYADYVWDFTEEQRHRDVDTLVQIQQEAGWHMLRNESVSLADGRLRLVGVENIGEPPFSTYGDLSAAMGGLSNTDSTFTVLLSHNPTHWRREVLPETNIDLMLAGHTHAVQLRIFGWSPAVWKYPEWTGLHSEGDQHLYVNTGLGCVGPNIRVGVRPELTIITLRSKQN